MKKSTKTLLGVGFGAIGVVAVIALIAKSKSNAAQQVYLSAQKRALAMANSGANPIVAMSGLNSYCAWR
jgi:ethanolamine utilization protein EutP (predicted NTPase)